MKLKALLFQAEERSLQSELTRLEAEEQDIDEQLALEKSELEQVKKEEERLWKVYRDHSRRVSSQVSFSLHVCYKPNRYHDKMKNVRNFTH